MKALHRKLLRDVWRMRSQAITIALVVAGGVAAYLGSIATWRSLMDSRDRFYDAANLGDVFAVVRRAPRTLLDDVRKLPGVELAEGRVTEIARIEVPNYAGSVLGNFVSIPPTPRLNRLVVLSGRLPERSDEAVMDQQFARAHALQPGAHLDALIGGKRSRLRLVGIAVSPEYSVVEYRGGGFQSEKGFGVFWMNEDALESAAGYEGEFTDLTVKLSRGASEGEMISAVDRLLEPWGSYGSYGRDRQPSNRFLTQEINQLRGSATVLPMALLGLAAFLLNVIMARVVATQREQVAALKAVGYPNRAVGLHYLGLVLAIVVPGTLTGILLGIWIGHLFVGLYVDFFHFPDLRLIVQPDVLLTAVAFSVIAAVTGALNAVRAVIKLAPAEAMRPEAPMRYRTTLLERLGLLKLFRTSGRMVARDLARQPIRSALSALGIAVSTAILIGGLGTFDAVLVFFDRQFGEVQREDLAVYLSKPLPDDVVHSFAAIAGVTRAEGRRSAALRMRAGPRSRDVYLSVVSAKATLRQLIDLYNRPIKLAPNGITLSTVLADRLGVRIGDVVDVEVMDDERQRRDVVVTGLVDDYLGLTAYMREDAWERELGAPPRVSEVLLLIERPKLDAIVRAAREFPEVNTLSQRQEAMQQFRKQVASVFLTYQLVLSGLAAMVAVGVVYNNARIAYSLRSRDLATLRILGFTRDEVGNVLVGEQLVQLVLGIPLGFPLGHGFMKLLINTTDPELYRVPLLFRPHIYATAAVVVAVAGIISAYAVRRRVKRMDLVAVLKARD